MEARSNGSSGAQARSAHLPLVLACSGASDVGHLTDRAARTLREASAACMDCLAGVAAHDPEVVARIRTAVAVLVIDGCEKHCGKRAMQFAGFRHFKHVCVTNLGLQKGAAPATRENVEQVAAAALAQIH